MYVKGAKGEKYKKTCLRKKIADVFIKTSAIFYRNLYKSYNDLYRFSVKFAVLSYFVDFICIGMPVYNIRQLIKRILSMK